MTAGFRQSDEQVVFEAGRGITFNELTLITPDGREVKRQAIRHPGAVAVVPMVDEEHAMLVRQYRAPFDAEVLEIPAGLRDVAGEDPADTAARELAEEIGYRAGSLELLTVFWNAVGLSDESTHVYLGTDLTAGAHDRHGPEEQAMEMVIVSLHDVPAMIANGDLRDAKSIIGLLMASERFSRD